MPRRACAFAYFRWSRCGTYIIPAGTRQNDVVSTSMRRDHVASTLIRHHFNVVCPLGCFSHCDTTRKNIPSDMCADEDSNQAAHSRSLIRDFIVRTRKLHPWLVRILFRLREGSGWSEYSVGAHFLYVDAGSAINTWAGYNISYKNAFVSSEDSDQPVNTRRLFRVFAVRLKMLWILGY